MRSGDFALMVINRDDSVSVSATFGKAEIIFLSFDCKLGSLSS